MRATKKSMRPAYTLLEVMCVVAVLVMISAIGTPVMQTMLGSARISAAGDMVRARLADTRSKALDNGRAWRLGFLPGTGVFQLAPDDSQEWDGAAQDPVRQDDLIRDELPPDVIFALNASDISGAGAAGAAGAAGGKWEMIAVYQWDGSALADTTTYFGKAGIMPMRINVRSLTGAVSLEVPAIVKADQP